MKTGLILEGGAMRGMFSCGVFDTFLEQNIDFDGMAGISAGACFGCNFKSRQIGRPIRYNMKYCRDPRYCSISSFLKTGDLFGADFCYRQIPEVLDPFDWETYRKNPMEFYIGATDIVTGAPVYYKCTGDAVRDTLWMRASASMPLVSQPVSADGRLLLDGGVTDSVPFRFMEAQGYNRNVILLTQPSGYRKSKSRWMACTRILLLKYPNLARAMENRWQMYNRQMEEIEQEEAAGKVLVIRPPEALGIHRTEKDPAELERVYLLGRKTAQKQLAQIKDFLRG